MGLAGTMLIAQAMHGWTGEQRWADAWRESAEALMGRRDEDGIWTQQLYGKPGRHLGPAHGLVGIVHALLQVESEWSESLPRETAEILAREAIVEDGLATWPAAAGGPLAPASGIRLQWCHGAPGMVATAAPYLDEELLLAGAELTWRAGAHREEKGAGLCHGTAGNGYALLKAFERTGDEQLARAGPPLRRPRARAGRGGARPVLAVHGRRRGRALRSGLPRRGRPLSDSRLALGSRDGADWAELLGDEDAGGRGGEERAGLLRPPARLARQEPPRADRAARARKLRPGRRGRRGSGSRRR